MIRQDMSRELRWVTVARETDLSRFPDFLIIGPQRTGTTWLHAHLRHHPQIFLPYRKELYFWSSVKSRDPKRFVSNEIEFYLRYFHDSPWRFTVKSARSFWKHGERYQPLVRGESTASYAVLDPDVIADIVALNPDLRAILMIRDPVDRAWSHAKKDLGRNRQRRLEDIPEAEFRDFFTNGYQLRCSRYVEQHDNWAAHLKSGHLLAAMFDDVVARPEHLLLEVMRFLGVRSDRRYIEPDVRSPVNPTDSSRIPEHYRRFLEDLFLDDRRKLKERFGLVW